MQAFVRGTQAINFLHGYVLTLVSGGPSSYSPKLGAPQQPWVRPGHLKGIHPTLF